MPDDAATTRVDERRIVRHALGLDASPTPYRNHYVAAAGGPDRAACERMAVAGLLRPFGEPSRSGTQTFHVTQAGADLIGAELPRGIGAMNMLMSCSPIFHYQHRPPTDTRMSTSWSHAFAATAPDG